MIVIAPFAEVQVGFEIAVVIENVLVEILQEPLHVFIVPAAFRTQTELPSVCLEVENPPLEDWPIYSANPIAKFAGPERDNTVGHDAVPAGILVGFVLISVSVPHLEASPAPRVQ